MFQTAIPVIQVSSSTAAQEFYGNGLGFTVLASWRPDETKDDPRYMTLARDGARLFTCSLTMSMGCTRNCCRAGSRSLVHP